MIRHYIVSAFRHIAKSKGVFAANVFGFTLNFIVVIFGLNYVLFEMSYDRFHRNGDRIYRTVMSIPEYDFTSANTPGPFAPTLAAAYPEVELAVRIRHVQSMQFNRSPNEHAESDAFTVAYADPEVFTVFSFGPIAPAAIAGFHRPNTALISRTMAGRIFGDKDPTGEVLYSDGLESGLVEVIGVMDDVPRNSHLRPDVFVPFDMVPENMIGWGASQFFTYVMLTDGEEGTLGSIREKLEGFPAQYVPQNQPAQDYDLEPLSEVYFSPHWAPEKGDINYVYFALVYLVLISFMTVANYMNINIAHLVRRVKEMGLRKSFGAGRTQVVSQFVVETLVNCLAGVAIAILAVLILRASQFPILEHLSRSAFSVEYTLAVGVCFLLIGLIAGIGPAFVFYRVNPVDMMANRVSTNWTAKPLGYERENKIVVQLAASSSQYQRLAEGFSRSPHVVSVGSSRGYPGNFPVLRVPWSISGTETKLSIGMISIGRDFFETLKIGLLHGRNFRDDELRNVVMLNETAFNSLGLDEEDVGTVQEIVGRVRVVGVAADFHIWSLHHAIEPLMLSYSDDRLTHLIVDIEPTNREAALDDLSRTFAELMPDARFEYFYLDEKLEEQYNSDRQILDTLILLALVAFALAVYWVYGRWISQYAYRAEVSPLLVVLPVLAVYVLTCVMVTRETLKTAGMKPAEVIQNVQQ